MRDLYNKTDVDSSPLMLESDSCGIDPFHDRFPWFRIIGRSYLYLSNLIYAASIIQKIPVVNEKGDVVGFLRIALQAVTG
jgi:kinesin family protein 1